jgi:mycoredoxin
MEELLKEQRVQYLRMDVEKDPEAKELYEAVGGGGVPILIVGNKLLRGFNHSAVLELLKSHQP